MPITFTDLLKGEKIEPESVHLVRHQDKKWGRRTPDWLWRTNRPEFERYQCIQSRPVFRVGNLIASFVATANTDTLFVDLYSIIADGMVPDGTLDPLGGHPVGGLHLYQIIPDRRLEEYAGKLTIDWGPGYRSWVQRAHKVSKPLLELRRRLGDPAFPGYLRFMVPLSEIETLHESWVARLREVKGVYVLTCPRTRELYVGSATGEGGFYERWRQHAGESGDAVQFRSREQSDYQVAILEVAGSNASDRDILHAEQLWMKKLQTSEMGLNGGTLRDGEARSLKDISSSSQSFAPA